MSKLSKLNAELEEALSLMEGEDYLNSYYNQIGEDLYSLWKGDKGVAAQVDAEAIRKRFTFLTFGPNKINSLSIATVPDNQADDFMVATTNIAIKYGLQNALSLIAKL